MRHGQRVIYKQGALRRVLRALEQNECVAILIDQYSQQARIRRRWTSSAVPRRRPRRWPRSRCAPARRSFRRSRCRCRTDGIAWSTSRPSKCRPRIRPIRSASSRSDARMFSRCTSADILTCGCGCIAGGAMTSGGRTGGVDMFPGARAGRERLMAGRRLPTSRAWSSARPTGWAMRSWRCRRWPPFAGAHAVRASDDRRRAGGRGAVSRTTSGGARSTCWNCRRDRARRRPRCRPGHFDAGVLFPNSFRSAWQLYRAGVARALGISDRGPRAAADAAQPHARVAATRVISPTTIARSCAASASTCRRRRTADAAAVSTASARRGEALLRPVSLSPADRPDRRAAARRRVRPGQAVAARSHGGAGRAPGHGARRDVRAAGAAHDRPAARAIESWLREHAPAAAPRVVDLVGQHQPRRAGRRARARGRVRVERLGRHASRVGARAARSSRSSDRPTSGRRGRPAIIDLITESVFCRPCMLRDCPIDHRCMKRITVDRVFDAVSADLRSQERGHERKTRRVSRSRRHADPRRRLSQPARGSAVVSVVDRRDPVAQSRRVSRVHHDQSGRHRPGVLQRRPGPSRARGDGGRRARRRRPARRAVLLSASSVGGRSRACASSATAASRGPA